MKLALLLLAVVACSPSKQRMPKEHRGDAINTCSPSSPGTAGSAETGCHADADCTGGKNGRCNRVGNNHAGYRNECGYDSCLADTDCPNTETCACTGGGNYCQSGNCRRDADCADTHACSPTPTCPDLSGGNHSFTAGYYCHTSDDTCVEDRDCSAKGYGFRCSYSSELAHWACTNPQCPMG